MTLGQRLTLLGPATGALALVALLVLGPGAQRELRAARVLAGPVTPTSWSARVEVVGDFLGVAQAVAGAPIDVQVDGAAASAGRSAADGTLELEVPVQGGVSGGPLHVRVTSGRDLLAEGDVPRDSPGFGGSTPAAALQVSPQQGALEIVVAVERGVIAAGFPERVHVRVDGPAGMLPGATLVVSADGADLQAGAGPVHELTMTTDPLGRVVFSVLPRGHVATLELAATAGEMTGKTSVPLPIVPGAAWLDPASLNSRMLRVVSPTAQPALFMDLCSERARLRSARVPVTTTPEGLHVATFPEPELLPEDVVWLTVSTDPRGESAGTVGWPVRQLGMQLDPFAARARALPPVLVLDGLPQVRAVDAARRARVRTWGTAAVAAAALAQALALAVFASRRRGGAAPRAETEPGERLPLVESPLGPIVGAAVVLVSLAAIGLVALWRIG